MDRGGFGDNASTVLLSPGIYMQVSITAVFRIGVRGVSIMCNHPAKGRGSRDIHPLENCLKNQD